MYVFKGERFGLDGMITAEVCALLILQKVSGLNL